MRLQTFHNGRETGSSPRFLVIYTLIPLQNMFSLAKLGDSSSKNRPTLGRHQGAVAAQSSVDPYPTTSTVSFVCIPKSWALTLASSCKVPKRQGNRWQIGMRDPR